MSVLNRATPVISASNLNIIVNNDDANIHGTMLDYIRH